MESKKISFGFKKTLKVEKPVIEDRKDYIECVEEKSIKIVGGEEVKETAPLVIPMKPNTLMTAERLKEIGEKIEKAIDEPETTIKQELQEVKPDNETLDQMAVRELLQDAKKEVKIETQELTVPIPSKPVMEGKKESTLEDYEAIPVQDFGLAMLRGMGWTPNKNKSTYKQPQLRPKGLGLGADKVITENQKKKSKESKEEELALVKNSFVLITSGKYNGYYGKVVSLDEENGRVMVDIVVKKETVSFSEFMLHPVTKAEYDKESKVINADKFAEYKKSEKLTQPKQKDKSSNRSSQSYDDENRPESINIETSNGSRREKDKRESSTPKRNDRRGNSSSDKSESEKRDKSPINAQSNTRHRRRSSSNPKRKLNTRDRSSSSDRHNLEKHSSKSNKSKYSEKRERNRSTSNSKERSRYKKRDSSSSEDRSRGRRKEKRDISSDKEVYSRETRKAEMKYRSKQRYSSSSEDKSNKYDHTSREGNRDSRSEKKNKSRERDLSSSEDRSHNRQKERYRSPKKRNKKDRYRSDSLSSLSGSDIRRKDKKSKRDSDSEDDYKSKKSSDGKRDIDKKRKGKKKKRDRERSPNYRKHKK